MSKNASLYSVEIYPKGFVVSDMYREKGPKINPEWCELISIISPLSNRAAAVAMARRINDCTCRVFVVTHYHRNGKALRKLTEITEYDYPYKWEYQVSNG